MKTHLSKITTPAAFSLALTAFSMSAHAAGPDLGTLSNGAVDMIQRFLVPMIGEVTMVIGIGLFAYSIYLAYASVKGSRHGGHQKSTWKYMLAGTLLMTPNIYINHGLSSFMLGGSSSSVAGSAGAYATY